MSPVAYVTSASEKLASWSTRPIRRFAWNAHEAEGEPEGAMMSPECQPSIPTPVSRYGSLLPLSYDSKVASERTRHTTYLIDLLEDGPEAGHESIALLGEERVARLRTLELRLGVGQGHTGRARARPTTRTTRSEGEAREIGEQRTRQCASEAGRASGEHPQGTGVRKRTKVGTYFGE